MAEKTIEEIEAEYKLLNQRRDAVNQGKMQVVAELNTTKRDLKATMEECKKAGFDPDNIQEEVRRSKEVLAIKLDNYKADLAAAESQLKPMLKEIQG